MNIIFFGSTSDSVIVLSTLHQALDTKIKGHIVAVVTQPPRPVGRSQEITSTPVEIWAKEHHITVLSFASDDQKAWLYKNESEVINTLSSFSADICISASYGQKIPHETIQKAQYGGVNVHPSFLPHWKGADPVPWAIAAGDHQVGVSIVTIADKFDDGKILAQKKEAVLPTDTSDPLRTKLFTLGAALLVETLPKYIDKSIKGEPQDPTKGSYAGRKTRETGFEPWESIQQAFADEEEAKRIERKYRAFHPWPGLWTFMTDKKQEKAGKQKDKRLKILSCHLSSTLPFLVLDEVQLEGKNPVSYQQFQQAYLIS